MKLLLISDAWDPQTNGVVTTYKNMLAEFQAMGLDTEVIHPGLFRNIPLPGYSEINLALDIWRLGKMIENANADFIHVSVEGPLGLAARRWLNKRKLRYTTSFHTRFPEYLHERIPLVPIKLGYQFIRWFHARSAKILVTTKTMQRDLATYGFENMVVWGRGVDTQLFKPNKKLQNDPVDPVFLYVGRVAVEKNIEAFLKLKLPGRKIIIGDGPSRPSLQKKYPDVNFIGYRYGNALAEQFANADVFVFPSRTDTFGLVMLEAMACGTPVAAYPVPGPIDVVTPDITGILNENLEAAALQALTLNRKHCREYALTRSWRACAETMRDNLVPAKPVS
jgi:glycosyltransferase involved in cell wall biosynthesis